MGCDFNASLMVVVPYIAGCSGNNYRKIFNKVELKGPVLKQVLLQGENKLRCIKEKPFCLTVFA